MHTIAQKKLLMLRPEDIVSNPQRPREIFDDRKLNSLARSIAHNGIIQPLIVTKAQGKKYTLISGERRLSAAKAVGLRRIPCIIHSTDGITAALYGITENMHKAPLNFFEEAKAISRLLQSSCATQSEIALRLGISKESLNQKLRLLRLSDKIQRRIIAARLSEGHARALLRLEKENRELVLEKIIAEALTVSQTEKFIDRILTPILTEPSGAQAEKQAVRKSAIGDLKLFANSLSKLLCTMQNAGMEVHSKKSETEKHIEFKIKIIKNSSDPANYSQLKIC